MANLINTTVFSRTGDTYTDGAYVEHTVPIQGKQTLESAFSDGKLTIMLAFFKSQSMKSQGFGPFMACKSETDLMPLNRVELPITADQAKTLNMVGVQSIVTSYLQSIYGADKVTEV